MRRSERTTEFVDFTRANRSELVRTAVLLCAGDEAFAEDVVQTTLIRLYLAWSDDTMLAFLGSVHVGPGALPGQG